MKTIQDSAEEETFQKNKAGREGLREECWKIK